MNVTVLGGTGLIGRRIVARFREAGDEVFVASPSRGVDAVTGEGLAAAVAGADVVVDVTNPPSYDEAVLRTFFETVATNVAAAAAEGGVRHLLPLSIVGADRMGGSAYMRGKLRQEEVVAASGVPFTILRATQFYEFLPALAEQFADGDAVRVPAALNQPIAADDVAAEIVRLAREEPHGGTVDLAGPETFPLVELVRRASSGADALPVVEDPQALYFGARLDRDAMVPDGPHRTGSTRFAEWLEAGRDPRASRT